MQHQLSNATQHVQVLMSTLKADLRAALAVIACGTLAIGFLLGILFMQWLATTRAAEHQHPNRPIATAQARKTTRGVLQ